MGKILFVDDQNEILELLRKKMQKTSFEVEFASSGSEALEKLMKSDIDVLVTDIMMHGMNGLDLIDETQKMYPELVKIVLSGNAQVSSIIDAINEGHVYRYIIKPWKIDEDAIEILSKAVEEAGIRKIKNNLKNEIYINIKELNNLRKYSEWELIDYDGRSILKDTGLGVEDYQERKIDSIGGDIRIRYKEES
ncbi:MAG: response regulator [Tissierellales bacterium]|jgi:DNA-binding NtrC family response regulator|nr:response regulator [Tissierellales bacterium]